MTLLGALWILLYPRMVPGIHVRVDYAFVGGISPGASVRVGGVTVGHVDRVELLGARPRNAAPDRPIAHVDLFIKRKAQGLITQGSQFLILPAVLTRMQYVDVIPGPADGAVVEDGTVVRGVDPPRTDMAVAMAMALMERADGFMDHSDHALSSLLRGDASLRTHTGIFLEDAALQALARSVRASVKQAQPALQASSNLVEDRRALRELTERAMVDIHRIEQLSHRAERLLAKLERGEGPLGKLMQDDDLYRDLKAVLDEIHSNPWRLLVPNPPRRK